jgi:hypothetical protein
MAASIIAILARGAIGGPLDPPGMPAPTLPQAEKRSPIPPVGWNGSFPIVVSQGSYYLTQNLIELFGTAPAIDIQGTNVTLDLNGFFIRGISTPKDGITSTTGGARITIENGDVEGWQNGINLSNADDVQVHDVTAWNNSNIGIWIGPASIVSHVTVTLNGSNGLRIDPSASLQGGIIEDSTITKNGGGIDVDANSVTISRNVISLSTSNIVQIGGSGVTFIDNTVEGTGTGTCIGLGGSANTVARNVISGCTVPIQDNGSGNGIGPATSNLTSTEPWSNVEHLPIE